MKVITQKQLENKVAGKRILVDSNIIIYLTDSISPYDQLSKKLFALIEQGDAQAVFSYISIVEVMSGPLKRGMASTALKVRDYLLNFPHSHSQEINNDVLNLVGGEKTVAWSKLRTADSLIIASGLINQVDYFISNDRHFKKALPKNVFFSFDQ